MSASFFPYHDIGLRCNPFRALTNDEWAEMTLIPERIQTLVASGKGMQILGDEGLGKTSLLLGLDFHYQREGLCSTYEYLPDGVSRFKTDLAGLDAFLLDEAQRLRASEMRRLLRAAKKQNLQIILGSHEDLGRFFQRAQITLASIRLTLSRERVENILQHKLAYFAREGTVPRRLSPSAMDILMETCSSCRCMEALLYDYFCTLPAGDCVTGDDLCRFLEAATPPAGVE